MTPKRLKIKNAKNSKSERSGKVKDRAAIAKENRSRKIGKKLSVKKSLRLFRRRRISKKVKKILLIIFAVFFLIFLAGGAYVFSYIQELSDNLPSPDEPFKNPPIASVIYDRNELKGEGQGTRLYKIIGEYNSDPVNIDEIPPNVKWAFLAGEDEDFYSHNGFDLLGIVRCGVKNVVNRSTVCGGSTITQQLLKLRLFSEEENPYERKLKELIMATQVEQKYDKDEILQMYLSVTGFGTNVTGIETASKYYFGVEPKDLTLAQGAILASIINDPLYLSPTKPIDGDTVRSQADVKERQVYVLEQMRQNIDNINDQHRKNIGDDSAEDIISEELIDEALAEEIVYVEPIATDIKAGHFVDYVQQVLTTQNYKNGEEPFTLNELQNEGYIIYTSLDYEQQLKAEEYTKFAGNEYTYWNSHNAAILTVDPNNGQILAMSGSKDYFGQSEGCNADGAECQYDPQVNVLTSLNEPGSTAKVLGYTAAFNDGLLFGGSIAPDIPVDYSEIGYSPKNWDGSYLGFIDIRRALVESRNITALRVVDLIGVDKYVDIAEKLGYTTFNREQVGQSIILGGASVKYTEHIHTFMAMANGGNYIPTNPILKIVDRDGNVVYEATVEKTEVFSPQSTFMTNEILNNLNGISSQYTGVPVSSKTGTTEGNTEALQVAWNSNQVTLAWIGNNNNNPLDQSFGYPVYMVTPWMGPYIRDISAMGYYQGKDPTLPRPGFVTRAGGGCNEKGECFGLTTDWVIQDKVPPSDHKSISVWVCKDQPDRLARDIDKSTGNAEERKFLQYTIQPQRWQQFVDAYFGGKGSFNGAPTKECDIDRSGGESGPFFYMSSPAVGGTVSTSLQVTGSIYTTSGTITAAQVHFDNQLLGSISNPSSFNQSFDISGLGLGNGTYRFKVVATDSNGISDTEEYNVILNSAINSGITFTQLPTNPWTSPVPFEIRVDFGSVNVSNGTVQLYQTKNGTTTLLGTMNNAGGNSFRYTWTPTGAGTYSFYVTGGVGNTGTTQSNSSGNITVN